jgi:lipid-A-disaccharide synthase
VEFVGHPLLDALDGVPTRAEARRQLGVSTAAPMVGLLPGSRREEVERLLPAMREAVGRVALAHPDTRFAVGLAPTVERAVVERHLAGATAVAVVDGRSHTVMRAADLLLVSSGTATLEAALLGTPMIVAYRLSRPSDLMVRLLVRVPWISLANLTLGRSVVPELYQDAATGARLADEALRLLGDAAALEAQREAFRELGGQLGAPGVGARAARLVLKTAWAA